MQSLISFIFIALFVYLIFSRKGGMGCCGGHSEPERFDNENQYPERSIHNSYETVIDLQKDEYTVIGSEYVKQHRINLKK